MTKKKNEQEVTKTPMKAEITDVDPPKKEIKVTDNISGSEYANAVKIQKQGDEIHLIFMTMFGEGENKNGKVTSKVTMTQNNYRQLLTGMEKHLKTIDEQKEGNILEKTK